MGSSAEAGRGDRAPHVLRLGGGLALAANPDSGLAVVVLIPLLWTALFHTKWESSAVVAVEMVISIAQGAVDATIIRRIVLWGLLGAVVSVAVHSLRGRLLAAHHRSERLRHRLQQVELTEDRLRIALGLHDDVVRRIFAATLTLRAVPASDAGERTHNQIEKAVNELDETIQVLRHTVFEIAADSGQSPSQAT